MLEEIPHYHFDDDLFAATRTDQKTRVRVYQPQESMVVLGLGSKVELEIHAARIAQDAFPLYRRRGGGCAVVLDPGNVIVTRCEHAPGFGQNKKHFQRLSHWLIQALETLGLTGLRQEGYSDIACGDRKLGGACLHRFRDTLWYTVSLLVDPDMSLVDKYLPHPPREPDWRRGRSHGEFLTWLGKEGWEQGAGALRESLSGVLNKS